jgi:hypothetical protein
VRPPGATRVPEFRVEGSPADPAAGIDGTLRGVVPQPGDVKFFEIAR